MSMRKGLGAVLRTVLEADQHARVAFEKDGPEAVPFTVRAQGLFEEGSSFRESFRPDDRDALLISLMRKGQCDQSALEYLEAFFYLASCDVPASHEAAKATLERFGSLGAVFAAEIDAIMATPGVSHTMALIVKTIHNGMLCTLREPITRRVDVGSDEKVLQYLGHAMKHAPKEQLRLLFLDRKNGLIREELVSEGTVDHVPLYPREVVRKALEYGASSIIIAHNHPSGDPTPSSQDIQLTKDIINALSVFGIRLHEHFIIGAYGIERLLQNGHIGYHRY